MNSKLCPETGLFNLSLQRISKNLVVLGHYRRIMIIWSGYRIHEPGLNNSNQRGAVVKLLALLTRGHRLNPKLLQSFG